MADVTVQFLSKVWVPVRPCQEVAVCLKDDSSATAVSGSQIVFATIENTGRYLGPKRMWEMLNPRDTELFEYSLTFDDTDFIEGNVPTCDDIVEINPYACSMHALLDDGGGPG